jgi:hypothetical protein
VGMSLLRWVWNRDIFGVFLGGSSAGRSLGESWGVVYGDVIGGSREEGFVFGGFIVLLIFFVLVFVSSSPRFIFIIALCVCAVIHAYFTQCSDSLFKQKSTL